MGDLVFAVEPLESAWQEMIVLAEKHWNETQHYRHNQPFNPLFDRYNQYAKTGCFLQFTARDSGRMVGYGGVYIVASMHTQCLLGTEDTWYLLPEYRKGWNAISFFRFMEEACKARGVSDITLTTPYGLNSGIIVKRLKYTPVATVWNKQFQPVKGLVY